MRAVNNGFKLRWDKKEKDWTFAYSNRACKTLMVLFFEMLKVEENIRFLQPHPILNPNPPKEDLKKLLADRGLDFTTFTITCKAKKEQQNEAN